MYISALSVYSNHMEPTPLEEFTFDQIYFILCSAEYIEDRVIRTGPVTYYEFVITGDQIVHYQAELEADVKAGTHVLKLDTYNDNWISYHRGSL